VLVFNSKLREELTGLPIVKECGLILQERVLSYVVITLQGLMLRGYDIIQTHGGSGSLATYLASVVDGNKCKLRVLGCYPADLPHIQRHVTKQGVKNMDLHCTPFLTYVGPDKPHVQAIVCTPPSTMSGIKEPFRYALYEGDYTVAGEKVQEKTTSLRQFVVHQTKTLRQALTYPKVSTIIYFTLSSNFQENEGVVRNCLEEYNEGCDNPAMRFNAIPVMPAVRKKMLESKDVTQDTTTTKDFFKVVEPEAGFAGGFVTVLYRKMPEDPPPPEEAPVVTSRNNTSILPYTSRNETNNINSSTSLTSITQKKKRRQPAKVIAMDPDYGAPVTGDFLKLALNEKGPSLQNFKKDFYQSYEMVMGPGSRAKMKQTMKVRQPKKEPEPVFPKVSQVITKAMESRKREKVIRSLEHEKIIKHPHPFK